MQFYGHLLQKTLWKIISIPDANVPAYSYTTTTSVTSSLAVAKKACDCCIILKSGSYTKAI